MCKSTFKNLRLIIIIILGIILISTIGLLYHTARFNNDIKKYISEDLTFSPDVMDKELKKLTKWTNNFLTTTENKGLLYERISNIYLWKGDALNHYSSIGTSLYYLEKSENYNTLVNLYLDLANFYILNGERTLTKDPLDRTYQIMNTNSDAVSNQMKCYLKRIEAMFSFENRKYKEALHHLEESDKFIEKDEQWGQAYFIINKINKAKNHLALGDLEKTKEYLKDCEESGLLNISVYVSIFNRDLTLPYYQVKSIYDAKMKNENESQKDLDKLIVLAENGEWQVYALNTLSSLSLMDMSQEYTLYISENMKKLYMSLAKSQTKNYVHLTNSQVETSKENEQRENNRKIGIIRNCILGIFLLIFTCIILFAVHRIAKASNIDGLTKIWNRRALDKRLTRIKRSGEPFVFMMIDIDDFKKVNDTYGHESGDIVLKELGRMIMDNYSNANLQCFRYGGEEFSIILRKYSRDGAVAIANSLCCAFAKIEWPFKVGLQITLSIGIASSTDGEDIVKSADENLYKAKTNGKNQACIGNAPVT